MSRFFEVNDNKSQNQMILVLTFIALFMHPMLTISLFALINYFTIIPAGVMAVWSFSYAVLIVNRQYYLENDDTAVYIPFIQKLHDVSFISLFTDERMTAAGFEPLPRFFWWSLSQLGFSIHFILFFQLLIWSLALVILANSISKRYMSILVFVSMTLYPAAIPYSFFHLYRHSWALAMMAYSFAYFKERGVMKWTLFSIFSHSSFVTMALPLWMVKYASNFRLMLKIMLFFGVFVYFSGVMDNFFDKVDWYKDSNISQRQANSITSIIGFFIFSFFYFFSERNDIHKVALFSCVVLFVIGFFPSLTSVYDCLTIAIIPLSLIVLCPIKNTLILSVCCIVSVIKFVLFLFSENNIYLFTPGRLFESMPIPIIDFIIFFVNGVNI